MREKIFLIFAFLTANLVPVYAYELVPSYSDNVRDFNYYSANKTFPTDADTTNSYPKVTRIESLLFKQTFVNEDIENRLSRIETKMFRRVNNNMSLSERVDLISNNIDPGLFYDISNDKLSYLENKIFARTYSNDDTETRIIRLEKEMLGAMQEGNLKERYDVVAQAAKHYTTFSSLQQDSYNTAQQPYYGNRYQNYQQYSSAPYSTYSSSNKSGLKNTLGNIVSGLLGVGTMTGFTPPIYPGQFNSGYQFYNPNNSNYYDPYTNQGIQDNRSTLTPYGYQNYNRSYGTGSGVKVLYD